jgi:hypothetical protein
VVQVWTLDGVRIFLSRPHTVLPGLTTLGLSTTATPNGRWRVFPFWYTLLALTEIDVAGAKAEKQFAARICERYLRRSPAGEFADRRRRVAERVMEKV